MKTIQLVYYKDSSADNGNTIEGYVKNEAEFKTWVGDHNMQRITDGNEPESIDEFFLEEIKYLGRK